VQYVICYDISDDRRRDRVATALLNYGARIQESVFVANLDETLAARMESDLRSRVDLDADRVHIFVLCAACRDRTVTFGAAEVVEDRPYYVI
jgi:CRISPR-associated protein Cas2